MPLTTRLARIVPYLLYVAVVLLGQASAHAQTTTPRRPNRALFGTQRVNPNSPQSAELNVLLFGAYDDNRLERPRDEAVDPAVQATGLQSTLQADARYRRGRDRTALTLAASTALRYTRDLRDLVPLNHSGAIAFQSRLWPGARLATNYQFSYSPYYLFAVFPPVGNLFDQPLEQMQASSLNYAVREQKGYIYEPDVNLEQSLGARTSVDVGYARRNVEFRGGSPGRFQDLSTERGHVRLIRRLTKGIAAHAGVGYEVARYALPNGPETTRRQDLDAGIDYSRPLSFSRRTTVTFSSGSSIIPRPEQTYYRVTGEATLNHEIGQTWTAGLVARRGWQFIEGFPAPFFSDSASAGIRGHLGRRVRVSVGTGYSMGDMGVVGDSGGYETYAGTSQFTFAVTRHLAVHSEYVYYHYRLRGAVPVPDGLAKELDRHSVRVGIKLWAPFLN